MNSGLPSYNTRHSSMKTEFQISEFNCLTSTPLKFRLYYYAYFPYYVSLRQYWVHSLFVQFEHSGVSFEYSQNLSEYISIYSSHTSSAMKNKLHE